MDSGKSFVPEDGKVFGSLKHFPEHIKELRIGGSRTVEHEKEHNHNFIEKLREELNKHKIGFKSLFMLIGFSL